MKKDHHDNCVEWIEEIEELENKIETKNTKIIDFFYNRMYKIFIGIN